MANKDSPRGFWPVRHLSGGIIRASEYPIASGYATNIFSGDVVRLVAGGGIQAAAAGNRVLGVFAGVVFTNAAGEAKFMKYWPASTVTSDAKAYVYDDPHILFGVQSAGTTNEADRGNLGDHVAGSGSTNTGRSAHELSGTTSANAAGFRIIDKIDNPGNDWGANVDLVVQVYEHEFTMHDPGTPGV